MKLEDVEHVALWWQTASIDERERLLTAIGAYAVTEQTWYVHPEKEDQ